MLKYNIPKSTVYSLKKKYLSCTYNLNKSESIYEDLFNISQNEIIDILNYVSPPKPPLTIEQIQKHIKLKHNIVRNKRTIKNLLKNILDYSYKRGSSISKTGTTKKIQIQQSVFSCRILSEILKDNYIINIDEASFNHNLKMEYSWLPKGITSAIINQNYSGSKSLIVAYCSDGEYLCMALKETVNSEIFCVFLCALKYCLKNLKLNTKSHACIVLDNAAYHSSKQTVGCMEKLELSVQFLPPYSPILAPVEQFFKLIKTIMRSNQDKGTLSLSTESGTKKIQNACKIMTKKINKKIWSLFIQNCFECILKINQF